jgi:hypothetical protein
MILGLVQDPGFGPVVVMGLGGTRTELLNDVVMVLPPFDTRMAKRALEKLKHSYLFKRPKTEDDENSSRNAIRHPVYDMDSFAQTAALFSAIAAEFSDIISELDINPIKVLERGCIGLDALLVRKQP